jgi:predicted DCC family thiol-disulfide oxidoreductase YuxK/uncharacterized membrane protein YphA (DoxX/SURF4 family)
MNVPEIFVNYVDDDTRESPINLAAVRVIMGVYILWRGASMEIRARTGWPVHYKSYNRFMYPPEGFEWILVAEKYLLLSVVLLFIVGYWTRICSFVVGLLFSHLTGVLMIMNPGGETEQMAIGSLIVFLFGLYSEQDKLSVDGFRRTRNKSLQWLNDQLDQSVSKRYEMTSLKYILLCLGVLYASSPVARFFNPGWFAWTSPENFARFLLVDGNVFRLPIVETLVGIPPLLQVLAWLAIILELGLILFTASRLSVTPVILGLLGMHIGIALTMGLFFLDMMIFLMLFASYDMIHSYIALDRKINILYDRDCHFCARSLYPFKLIDTNDSLRWYTQYNAPESYLEDETIEVDKEMYVFIDGKSYGGYYAFRQVFKQFPETVLLAWVMKKPPVSTVGERIYRYVAENRDHHFMCSYDPNSEP